MTIAALRGFHSRVSSAGNRANTLHYLYGRERIGPSDMVLVDCGAAVGGYCSDLSQRPISGTITAAQQAHYEALIHVQETLIDCVQYWVSAGQALTLRDLHVSMLVLIGQQLQALGSLGSRLSEREVAAEVDKLCPHACGHYLGIDVHDTDSILRTVPLEPGMVNTIEPGLYVRDTNTDQFVKPLFVKQYV